MIRLWKIAFLGSPKSEIAGHAKENGLVMTVPLCLLAIGSTFGGFVWAYPESLKPIIEAGESIADGEHHTTVAIFSIVAWAIGLVTAWFLYQGGAENDRLESGVKPLYRIFKRNSISTGFTTGMLLRCSSVWQRRFISWSKSPSLGSSYAAWRAWPV